MDNFIAYIHFKTFLTKNCGQLSVDNPALLTPQTSVFVKLSTVLAYIICGGKLKLAAAFGFLFKYLLFLNLRTVNCGNVVCKLLHFVARF